MTVQDLVDQIQGLPPDAEVIIRLAKPIGGKQYMRNDAFHQCRYRYALHQLPKAPKGSLVIEVEKEAFFKPQPFTEK